MTTNATGSPRDRTLTTTKARVNDHLNRALELDRQIGSEGVFYRAALEASKEYVASTARPVPAGDRVLERINNAIDIEPAKWPNLNDYVELRDASGGQVNETLSGILRTDGAGFPVVCVFGHFWKALCGELRINSAIACRELDARQILQVTDSSRRANEWTSKVRSTGAKMYLLRLERLSGDGK